MVLMLIVRQVTSYLEVVVFEGICRCCEQHSKQDDAVQRHGQCSVLHVLDLRMNLVLCL